MGFFLLCFIYLNVMIIIPSHIRDLQMSPAFLQPLLGGGIYGIYKIYSDTSIDSLLRKEPHILYKHKCLLLGEHAFRDLSS